MEQDSDPHKDHAFAMIFCLEITQRKLAKVGEFRPSASYFHYILLRR